MNLSSQSKVLILIAIVIVVILVVYIYYYKPVNQFTNINDQYLDIYNEQLDDPQYEKELDMMVCEKNYQQVVPNEIKLRKKFRSKNHAKNCEYKVSNYADGIRGNNDEMDEFTKFYQENNSLIKNSMLSNNNDYCGIDETENKYAIYKNSSNKNPADLDLFNASNFLPQEANNEWFETLPDAIPIENNLLISICRPVGVNTVGSSNRNPAVGGAMLQENIPNPRMAVSPFMNSSIDANYNTTGLCGK